VGVVLFLFVAAVGFLSWCMFGSGFVLADDPVDHVEEFLSPDGARKAVLYRASGGWQICILPAERSLPKWRRPVFTTDDDLTVAPHWTDPVHLTVVYGPGAFSDGGKAIRRISSFGSVKIAYHYVP